MLLQFRLGSISVTVEPWFFLTVLFLGMRDGSPITLLAYAIVLFISILVHELGHALAGRLFGLKRPEIVLRMFGGFTAWPHENKSKLTSGQNFVVSFAGPFITFLMAGSARAAMYALSSVPVPMFVTLLLNLMFLLNLIWGLFNCLPMLPLDGGHMLESLLGVFTRRGGKKAARYVSIVVCAVLAVYQLTTGSSMFLIFTLLWAWNNWQEIQLLNNLDIRPVQGTARPKPARGQHSKSELTLADGYKALEKRDTKLASEIARTLMANRTIHSKDGVLLLARSYLIEGNIPQLMLLLRNSKTVFQTSDLLSFADAALKLDYVSEAAEIRSWAGL